MYGGEVVGDDEFKADVALTLDVQTRRSADGSALLGGNRFRILRLSEAGQRRLDGWLAGPSPYEGDQQEPLYERLVGAGLAHPVVSDRTKHVGSIGVVIPVLDDPSGLEAVLDALARAAPDAEVVVVDDGSYGAATLATIAKGQDASLVRHEINRGPGAARNSGWRWLVSDDRDNAPHAIAFIDTDVTIDSSSLSLLLAHLEAGTCSVVAPRVASAGGSAALDAYETTSSPLDLGEAPALVEPRTRTSYVPSAMLMMSADVLVDVDGFDESIRVGEDVDFVWRALGAGHRVRYEPSAVAEHRNRPTVSALARQRFAYGTSAALLEQRHPETVFPVEVSLQQGAIWLLFALGGWPGRLVGMAGLGLSTRELATKFAAIGDDAQAEAIALTVRSHGLGLRWFANAITRAWWPALILFGRRPRRLVGLAFAVPAAIDYFSRRPKGIDPLRFLGFRIADHAAYSAGAWMGAARGRSVRSLAPRFRR